MSYFSYKPVLTNEYFHGKPLVIDHSPQMLFGDVMVEDVYRVVHEQQTPVRYGGNPVFRAEAPWEAENIFRPSVIYDNKDGKYKMWYSSSRHVDDSGFSLEKGNGEYICYAESDDGIRWIRPELSIYKFGKWDKNNIVMMSRVQSIEIGRVIMNPDMTDLIHRFIMVTTESIGIRLSYSPDGIHWSDFDGFPQISVPMDCSLCFGYDESRMIWQIFTRPSIFAKDESLPGEKNIHPNMNYRRRVCVTESRDLMHWSVPRIVYQPPQNCFRTEADNIDFFTVGNYPVAFIHCFAVHNIDGCHWQRILPYLAFGRDVYHLRTLSENKPIIDYGRMPSYDDQRIIIDSQPHDLFGDGRSYFYYRGYHHDLDGNMEISFNILSFDGNRYCARYADEYGGWLLTREFIFDGSSIEIDADIPDEKNGKLEVEIVDPAEGHVRGGYAIKGYRLENCDALYGDSKHHVLSYNGRTDLSALKGQRICLRFHLVNARLYSFTVNE